MPIESVDLVAAEEAARAEEELHSLPELFLENTRLRPHHVHALRRRARELATARWREVLRQSCKTYASSPRVPLPDPRRPCDTPPFGAVAVAARAAGAAAPQFSRAELEAADLSRLLFYARGTAASAAGETVPATGIGPVPEALHPLELYVVLARPEACITPGVYHYNGWLHCLEALETADAGGVAGRLDALLADGESHGAAAAVITTAVPLRVRAAYGDRGYRMLLIEAGRLAERLQLGARALGLTARQAPHFFDDSVDRLLGLDGVDELAVGVCLAGPAAEGGAG